MPSSQDIYDMWDREENRRIQRLAERYATRVEDIIRAERLNNLFVEGAKIDDKRRREQEALDVFEKYKGNTGDGLARFL